MPGTICGSVRFPWQITMILPVEAPLAYCVQLVADAPIETRPVVRKDGGPWELRARINRHNPDAQSSINGDRRDAQRPKRSELTERCRWTISSC